MSCVGVLSKVSRRHTRRAAGALGAVFAMEPRDSAPARAETIAAEMESGKLGEAACVCLLVSGPVWRVIVFQMSGRF
jgi:hypothetical protein